MSHHKLNINTTTKKFKFFERELSDNLHILLISETKLHDSFPLYKLLFKGFLKPCGVSDFVFALAMLIPPVYLQFRNQHQK